MYPEHFYEHAGGRGSNFLKPVLHNRSTRLDFEHAGEFAQECLSRKGEASVHVFVLSHLDLLSGPTNDHLGEVCETILQVSHIATRTIVLFLALFPLQQLTAEMIASAVNSKERVLVTIGKNPLQSKWMLPQVIPTIVLSLSSPAKADFQALFYREITQTINEVIFRNNSPRLRPPVMPVRPQAPVNDTEVSQAPD